MIRRVIIAVAISTFMVGVLTSEATAFERNKTSVEILSTTSEDGRLLVRGDLHSSFRGCTQQRVVALFLDGKQVQRVKSNKNGIFNFNVAEQEGDYLIVAFKEARDGCSHVCRIGTASFSWPPELPA